MNASNIAATAKAQATIYARAHMEICRLAYRSPLSRVKKTVAKILTTGGMYTMNFGMKMMCKQIGANRYVPSDLWLEIESLAK